MFSVIVQTVELEILELVLNSKYKLNLFIKDSVQSFCVGNDDDTVFVK